MVKIYLKHLINNQNLPNNRPSKSNKMWVTEGKFDIIIQVGTCRLATVNDKISKK